MEPAPAHGLVRNQGIDLLRGLSILFVILNHIGLRIPLAKTALVAFVPRRFLSALNFNGYEAVFVFFVISGFLITGNSLRRWPQLEDIDLHGFYARRFARIVPCLLLLVLVLSVLDLAGVPDYVITHAHQSLAGAVSAALGLYLNWYEGHTGYLPGNWDVLWSLSIEEFFYIGFPLLCLVSRRMRLFVPLLCVLALSMPFTHAANSGNEIWQEKAYLTGMAAIALGVLGALVAAHVSVPSRRTATALCATGTAGLIAILFAGNVVWAALRDGYLLVLTGSVLCLLLGFHWRERTGAVFRWRGLGWLRLSGRYSYEIYLTHMFVVYAAVRLFRAAGSHMGSGYLWYLPILIACAVLGITVGYLISTPADRALRSILLEEPHAKPANSAV